MYKNKKGFTLVELIAVVAFIAVVVLIATPNIINQIKRNKKNRYQEFMGDLCLAAEAYINHTDKANELQNTNDYIILNISDLIAGGYVKSTLKNPETDERVADSSLQVILNSDKSYSCTLSKTSTYQQYATQHLNTVKALATGHEGVYFFDSDGNLDYGNNTKITTGITEQKPKGVVSFFNNKVIYACFNYGNNNYEYDLTSPNIKTRNMKCLTDRYQNLIINGNQELKDNTNFSKFTYKNGHFEITTDSVVGWKIDDYIPIDPNKKYEMGFTVKTSNTESTYHAGFLEYDVDKIEVASADYMYIANTLTELTEDLKPGDTVVHLKDLTNWNVNTGSASYMRGFIFWNYSDSTGYTYPASTYSKNNWYNIYRDSDVNKTAKTINLYYNGNPYPWPQSYGTIPAGTKVSQRSAGAAYNYCLLGNRTITSDWKKYNSNIISNSTNTKFRPGSRFVKPSMYIDYNSKPNTTFYVKDFYFKEVKE